MRLELIKHINLPTRNEVDSYKLNILPTGIISEPKKTECDVSKVIENTVERLDIKNTSNEKLTVFGKFGLDGSGIHNIRHQKD